MEQISTHFEDHMHITDYLDLIWQYRRYFMIPFILIPLIMLVYIFNAPKEYQTQTSIFIDESYFHHPILQDYALTINLEERLPTIEQQLTADESLNTMLEAALEEDLIASHGEESVAEIDSGGSLSITYIGPGLVSISCSGRNPQKVRDMVVRASKIYVNYALEPTRGIGKKLLDRLKQRDRILTTQIQPHFNQAKLNLQDAERNFTENASELMFAREEYHTWLKKMRDQEKVVEEQVHEIIPLKGGEVDRSKVVQVVSAAKIPTTPYKPRKMRLMLIALLAGAICGGLMVYIRQFFDSSLHKSSEIETYFEIPVIGRIPKLWTEESPNKEEKKHAIAESDGTAAIAPESTAKRLREQSGSASGIVKKPIKPKRKIRSKHRNLKRIIFPSVIILLIGIFILSTDSKPTVAERPLKAGAMNQLEELLLLSSLDAPDENNNLHLVLSQFNVSTIFRFLNSEESRAKTSLVLLNDRYSISASLRLIEKPIGRFINVRMISRIHLQKGSFLFDIDSIKIGYLRMPSFLANPLINGFIISRVFDQLKKDDKMKTFLSSIQDIKVKDRRLTITYSGKISLANLFAQGSSTTWAQLSNEEKNDLVNAYKVITELVQKLHPDSDHFREIVKAAFTYSAQLTNSGMPALKANKIALCSLGLYFGEPKLQKMLDPGAQLHKFHFIANENRPKAKIHGRSDWAQHFIISAMLTALFDAETANRIGINKELRDLDGVGFNFGDIWADRAGVLFGKWALKDEETAAKTIHEIQQGFVINRYFPVPTNLSGPLNRQEFESIYYTTKSPEFRQELQEIDTKLLSSGAYQES